MNNNFNWSIKLVNICYKVLRRVVEWKLQYRKKEWRNAAGELHREDGPAVILKNGSQEWYANNKLHRLDGPAVIHADGTQYWFVNGKLHRDAGDPAVIWPNGTKKWYVNGKLHRLDGPAYVWANGYKEWLIDGKNITKEVNEWIKNNNIRYPFNDESLVLFKLRFS